VVLENPVINVSLLRDHLVEVSECEGEFMDHVYAGLFSRRPDARELFGRYSEANKRQMTGETLAAVLNMIEREPWVGDYIRAMGLRHQFSYETPTDLYAPYAEAVLDALAAVSGATWTPELQRSWKAALDRVNEMMTDAYVTGQKLDPTAPA